MSTWQSIFVSSMLLFKRTNPATKVMNHIYHDSWSILSGLWLNNMSSNWKIQNPTKSWQKFSLHLDMQIYSIVVELIGLLIVPLTNRLWNDLYVDTRYMDEWTLQLCSFIFCIQSLIFIWKYWIYCISRFAKTPGKT